MLRRKSIIALTFLISSCAKQGLPVAISPCPPSPLYPRITDAELVAITNETYNKIVDNLLLRDLYINELKVNCK